VYSRQRLNAEYMACLRGYRALLRERRALLLERRALLTYVYSRQRLNAETLSALITRRNAYSMQGLNPKT